MTYVDFVLATAAVVTIAALLAARLGLEGRTEWWLAVAVLAISEVVASTIVAGAALRSFRPLTLLVLNGGIAAVLLATIGPARPRFANGGRSEARAWVAGHGRRQLVGRLAFVLAVLAGVELAWLLLVAVVLPPHGFDSLAYHLPTIAEWVQRGSLARNPLTVFAYAFPNNGEVITAWSVVFLHGFGLVSTTQVVFAVVAASATAGLGRGLGLSRPAAVAAGCMMLLTPIVVAQATTTYVDIVFAALFLLCIFFLARVVVGLRGEPAVLRLGPVALAGLSGGLALGSKSTGPVYVAVAAVVLGVHLAWARLGSRLSTGAAFRGMGLFLTGVVLLGGFWFARNLVDFHNPIYPVRVHVAGLRLPGLENASDVVEPPSSGGRSWPVQVARSWAHDLVLGSHGHGAYAYDQREGGMGPQWVYLELPLLVGVGVWALWRRDVAIVTVLAVVGLAFLLQPYRWWSRFTIVLVAPGAIAVLLVIERVARRRLADLLALLSAGLVAVSLPFSSLKFGLGTDRSVSATDVIRLIGTPAKRRNVVYPPFRWLDGIDPRARVGVEAALRPDEAAVLSPIYGPHLDRTLVALDTASDTRFLGQISRDTMDYLVVAQGSAPDQWAAAVPTRLQFTFGEDGFRVYRVEH